MRIKRSGPGDAYDRERTHCYSGHWAYTVGNSAAFSDVADKIS